VPKPAPQCTARLADGSRCKRKTAMYGPFCWQHTQLRRGLEVKKSKHPAVRNLPQSRNKGLFVYDEPWSASRDEPKRVHGFRRGKDVAQYGGRKLTKQQYERAKRRGKKGDYITKLSKNQYLDSSKTNSGMARYANDHTGSRRPQNTRIVTGGRGRRRKTTLEATKRIRPGKEVLTSYGGRYWRQ